MKKITNNISGKEIFMYKSLEVKENMAHFENTKNLISCTCKVECQTKEVDCKRDQIILAVDVKTYSEANEKPKQQKKS